MSVKATYTYRATRDAVGTFVIDLLHDNQWSEHRTFLFSTHPADHIKITAAQPAVIEVQRKQRTTARK